MILAKDKTKIFNIMLVAYSFFAFLSPQSQIFSFILLALMVSSIFIFDDNDVLCFLTFSSCFMSCFRHISTFLKGFYLVIAIAIIKQLVLSIKNKNKKNILFICSIFIFCLTLFIYSLFVSKFHIYKPFQCLGIVVSIGSLYLSGNVSVKKLTLSLSVGLIVSSICSILSYTCGIMTIQPFLKDSCGFRFSAYFNYVNSLAFYCSLCQTCILTLFLTKTLNIKKWGWLSISITCIGLCTFSKSFILMTILTYGISIVIAFTQSKNKKNFIKFSLIGLILLIILVLIFNNYISHIIKRFYIDNSYGGGLDTATTGRLGIWKSYLKHWASSFGYILFGCGITADCLNGFTPHNFYISLLYRFGLIGILLLIAIIVFIVKNNKVNKNICWYFPLFIVLINSFAEDISSSLFTCLPLLIALCFILKNSQDYHK